MEAKLEPAEIGGSWWLAEVGADGAVRALAGPYPEAWQVESAHRLREI